MKCDKAVKHALCAAAVLFGGGVAADTWLWRPTVKVSGKDYYSWNDSANWTNETGQAGVPGLGDTVVFGQNASAGQCYNVGNPAVPLEEVRFEKAKKIESNQGSYFLRAGGKGFRYLYNANCTGNWSGINVCGEGEVEINIANNITYAMQKSIIQKTYEDYTGNTTVVKTGPGKIVCCNQSGNYYYTVPLTLIREGAIDITLGKVCQNVLIGFDGNDPSQRLTFGYSDYTDNLVLNNSAIFETNGVANTEHGIACARAQQLIFTGTPKMNPMVFSGKFYTKAGLTWNPASSDYVFVCSNAVSKTEGVVNVKKGTVKLVTGASFQNLSELAVSAGAVFEVEEGSGEGLYADMLTLPSPAACLKLATGVTLTANAFTLNGSAQKPGTYTADGRGGTIAAAWIEGAGQVVVQTGPSGAFTWTGAGADTRVTTGENWADDEAPNLATGDALATFATGGETATLPAGTAAKFDGMVLTPEFGGNAFTFEAGAGASLAVGVNGLTVQDAAATTTWRMGWPVTVDMEQTWTVGANSELSLRGGLSGTGNLTVNGSDANSTLTLTAPGTHSGALAIHTKAVNISADNALGTDTRTVQWSHGKTFFNFIGETTHDAPMYSDSIMWEHKSGAMRFAAGSKTTFNGNIGLFSDASLNLGADSVTTFKGGLRFVTEGMAGRGYLTGTGTMVVRDRPISTCRSLEVVSGHNPTVRLAVTGNYISTGNSYWARFFGGRLVLDVDNALANSDSGGPRLYMSNNAELDLNGHDVRIGLLQGTSSTRVTSAEPATLQVDCLVTGSPQYGDYGGVDRVMAAVFSGKVSVRKTGTYPFTFGAESPSVGKLTVEAGELRFAAGGSWPNATNVTVTGGALVVRHAGALGTEVEVDVSGAGKVKVDFAGRFTNGVFRVNGVKQPGNVYGAVGSGAPVELSCIEGEGFVYVRPVGTAIIFR